METITEFEARMYRLGCEREREAAINGLKLIYIFFFTIIAALGVIDYQEHKSDVHKKKSKELTTLLEAEFRRYDTTGLGNEPFSKRLEMVQAFVNGQIPKEPLYNSRESLAKLVEEGKMAKEDISNKIKTNYGGK